MGEDFEVLPSLNAITYRSISVVTLATGLEEFIAKIDQDPIL